MYIPAVTAVCNWTKKSLPANFQTWEWGSSLINMGTFL